MGWLPLVATGSFALTFGSGHEVIISSAGPVDFGTMSYPSGASRIVVCIGWVPNPGNVSAVNIVGSGVTFSQISGAFVTNPSGAATAVDAWISSGPVSGSSGDVQISLTNTVINPSVALYGLTAASLIPGTPGTAFQNNTNTLTATATIPAGGGAIALTSAGNDTALTSLTHTSAIDYNTGGGLGVGRTNVTGSVSVTSSYGNNDGLAISIVPFGP